MFELSYARRTEPIVPRTKVASTLLDSTATTIYTASTSVYVEDAVLLFTNNDSVNTSYDLYLRGTGGNDVDSNQVVTGAVVPANAHGEKDIKGFGDGQVLTGKSSANVVTATLIGRLIDRSG